MIFSCLHFFNFPTYLILPDHESYSPSDLPVSVQRACPLGSTYYTIDECMSICTLGPSKLLQKETQKFPQKVRHRITVWPSNPTPLLGVYPKELKTDIHKNMCTWIFIELFTIAKGGNNPNTHQWMNGYINVIYPYSGILNFIFHTMEYKKKWRTDRCYNMDEPEKNYAK